MHYLVVDRSAADPHGVHTGSHVTAPIPLPPGPVAGLLVEDHGLIEEFLDGGKVAMTSQTFPHVGPVRVASSGGATITCPSARLLVG